jgi:hypothetical protein
MTPLTSADMSRVTLREVRPEDAEACAQICFEAFGGIHDHHRFPRDFPAIEAAAGLMAIWIPHPMVWALSPSSMAASSDPTSSMSAIRSGESGRSRSRPRARARASAEG